VNLTFKDNLDQYDKDNAHKVFNYKRILSNTAFLASPGFLAGILS